MECPWGILKTYSRDGGITEAKDFEKEGVDGRGHGRTYRTLTPKENFRYITLAYPPIEEDQPKSVDEIDIDGV